MAFTCSHVADWSHYQPICPYLCSPPLLPNGEVPIHRKFDSSWPGSWFNAICDFCDPSWWPSCSPGATFWHSLPKIKKEGPVCALLIFMEDIQCAKSSYVYLGVAFMLVSIISISLIFWLSGPNGQRTRLDWIPNFCIHARGADSSSESGYFYT